MNLDIYQQNKIKITVGDKSQSVEISQNAVKAGFLKKFPDSSLSVFIYLITHLKNDNSVFVDPSTITDQLPYKLKTIIKALNYLEKNDIITILQEKSSGSEENLYIKINLENLILEQTNKNLKTTDNNSNNDTGTDAGGTNSDINSTTNNLNSRKDLKLALINFIPFDKDKQKVTEDIEQWLKDFEPKQVKELIRRVNKWQHNTNSTTDKAFYYLKAIVKDWYEKEIFSYDRLQYFDQLYRETKKLAKIYGIKPQNLNSVQMQTFKNWLTEDFALSMEVVQFAIKEAIKRKKDGQPSLKYIEDNFIKPWKKAGIRNKKQAQKVLNSSYNKKENQKENSSNSNKKTQFNSKKQSSDIQWEDFPWNVDKISQGGLL